MLISPASPQLHTLPSDILSMTGGQMADADDRRTVTRAREAQPLSAERIDEIRARILAGAYATEPVVQAVARAILERGALQRGDL
jgi:hypothetical protein